MNNFFYITILLLSSILFSQKRDSLPKFNDEYFLVKEGDTLMIELEQINLLPKHKFKSLTDANYYYWFRKKVFKAYPYAVLASERLDSLNVRLSKIKSKRKKRKYIRVIQKYVEKELTDQLKKMTRTEGRILIKLIYRQTGKTAFNIIKELRSGWKAFWYNTTANFFKLSLKLKYDPSNVNEDYLIEDVLQRAFVNESLIRQKPKLIIPSYKILLSHGGDIDVDKYKLMFSRMRSVRYKK